MEGAPDIFQAAVWVFASNQINDYVGFAVLRKVNVISFLGEVTIKSGNLIQLFIFAGFTLRNVAVLYSIFPILCHMKLGKIIVE